MENDIFKKYKTFVMVGKPGSGKGMQTRLLAEKSGFKTFSTGDKFRELQKADTPLGHKTAEIMDRGSLMPYWFAGFLFQEAVLYLPENEGIIYEGAARKAPEAELFHDVMTWLERPYKAIYLDVHDDEVTKRLIKRGGIENRADDNEEAIKHRLKVYQEEVVPAVQVFQKYGTILDVNGDQTPEEVHQEILKMIAGS
ncbi:MAG: nucleoside monophosphate kinase [Candidatus Paceibacterota bacterium]|jgi:adenylate kinase|nr:nucleoside monophosphate kinase [Candidatus Paceibacterota bacterium]